MRHCKKPVPTFLLCYYPQMHLGSPLTKYKFNFTEIEQPIRFIIITIIIINNNIND